MNKLRAVLRRRWPILLLTLVVGAAAGAISAKGATDNVQKRYVASQTILANSSSGKSTSLAQDGLKVTRGAVRERAAELLGRSEDAAALAATIGAAVDNESGSITISSEDLDPEAANARVDAFVKAFLEVINTELQSGDIERIDALRSDADDAQRKLDEFDDAHPEFTQSGYVPTNDFATQALLNDRQNLVADVAQLEAQVRDSQRSLNTTAPYETLGPEAPRLAESGLLSVPTSVPVRTGLIGLLGVLLGAVVAMVIERVNRRIDTRDELTEVIDVPILAEIGFIPEGKRSHSDDGTLLLEGVWSEPYRRIRSAIQFVQKTPIPPGPDSAAAGERYPSVFLVTSASPREGKSTSSALIAQALAEVGTPTVLIGGDFRRPSVERLLGADRDPSIQDLARLDPDRPTIDDVVRRTRFDSLYVAASGKATREVTGVFDAIGEIAVEATHRGATVIIDSSPLLAANDTIDILPYVDYVLLIVRSGRSTESSVTDTLETLRRMGTKILGLVLTGTPSAGRQQAYYYDYYNPSAEEMAAQATVMPPPAGPPVAVPAAPAPGPDLPPPDMPPPDMPPPDGPPMAPPVGAPVHPAEPPASRA